MARRHAAGEDHAFQTSSDLSLQQSSGGVTVSATSSGQPLLVIAPASMSDRSGSTAGVSSKVSQTLSSSPGSSANDGLLLKEAAESQTNTQDYHGKLNLDLGIIDMG